MNKLSSTILLLSLAASSMPVSAASAPPDARSYLQQQGRRPHDSASLPRSPVPDVVPLMFYDKGNSVPSCGLLVASSGGKGPAFVELVGSDAGVGFPQCLSIASITTFKLLKNDYLVVEYLSRETREDVDHRFHYLVRSAGENFVTDKALTEAAPVTSAGQGATGAAAKPVDGVRFARLAQLSKAQPTWRLLERDFISDKSSSFATFEDKKASGCQFVTEAGAAPVVTSSNAFAPSEKCNGVLASSRFEKSGKIYYVAMFKTQSNQQLVGITSVAADGRIDVEKTLSASINRGGMTRDMKTAKAALIKGIR
jgi:hypothetical protein